MGHSLFVSNKTGANYAMEAGKPLAIADSVTHLESNPHYGVSVDADVTGY